MAADKHETELNVISWNVNGLKEKNKDRQNINVLMKIFRDYDTVLLQETHLGKRKKKAEVEDLVASVGSMKISSEEGQSESENEVGEETEEEDIEEIFQIPGCDDLILEDKTCSTPGVSQGRKMYKANLHSRSRGVAILVNKPHNCLKAYSEGGDFAWVYIEIDGQKYTYVSVYYHKDESGLMLKIRQSFLIHEPQAWTESKLVIGGDFNTTLNPNLDLEVNNPAHSPRRNEMIEFMTNVKLVDVWRTENPIRRSYTYSCYSLKSRLDYVFMLKRDYKYVLNCVILHEDRYRMSDHYPVVLTTKIVQNEL